MKSLIKKKGFKQIIALLLLFIVISSTVVKVCAVSFYQVNFIFGDRNYVWRDVTTDPGKIGDKNKWPIKANLKLGETLCKTLSFDVRMGISRDLVTYTGEIPAAIEDMEGVQRVPYIRWSEKRKSGDSVISDGKAAYDAQGVPYTKDNLYSTDANGRNGKDVVTYYYSVFTDIVTTGGAAGTDEEMRQAATIMSGVTDEKIVERLNSAGFTFVRKEPGNKSQDDLTADITQELGPLIKIDTGVEPAYWGKYTKWYDALQNVSKEISVNIDNEEKLKETLENTQLSVVDLENAVKEEVTSLRIYALTKINGGTNFLNGLAKLPYKLFRWLSGLGNKVLGLFISAKNLDVVSIQDSLGLSESSSETDKAAEKSGIRGVFNRVFFRDPDTGQLSIFVIFAIISFILMIVGYVVGWVRGNKKSSLRDIIIYMLCGTMVLFMGVSTKGSSIGASLANIVSSMVSDTIDGMTGDDNIFKTTTYSSANSSVISLNEKSILNKALIDIQLATQFGISDIGELNLGEQLQVPDEARVSTTDLGLSSDNFEKYFDNNIGYWFWYLNSPAPSGSYSSAPKDQWGSYRGLTQTADLSDFMTGLQYIYDDAIDRGDEVTKEKILSIVYSFADPKTGYGALVFLFLFIEFILLLLCLWKLVIKILIAKLIVAGSVLSFPIAGPLLMTARPKFTSKGKMILLLFFTYSIQIFILSVIFDLVLYIIGFIIGSANIVSIMLAVAATIGVKIFLPKLMYFLDRLFESIDRAVDKSGGLTQSKRSVKQAINRGIGNFNRWNDGRTKTKRIVQEDGTVTYAKVPRKGGILSTIGHLAQNEFQDARSRSTGLKVLKDQRISRREGMDTAFGKTSSETKGRVDGVIDSMTKLRESKEKAVFGELGGKVREKKFENIKREALTDENKKTYDDIKSREKKFEIDKERYDQLSARSSAGEQLTIAERKELKSLESTINKDKAQIKADKEKLETKVQSDIQKNVNDRYEKEFTEKIDNQIKTNEDLLRKGGKTDKMRDAAAQNALAKKQLAEFKEGRDVSKTELSDVEKLEAQKEYHKLDKEGKGKLTTAKEDASRQKKAIEEETAKETFRMKKEEAKEEQIISAKKIEAKERKERLEQDLIRQESDNLRERDYKHLKVASKTVQVTDDEGKKTSQVVDVLVPKAGAKKSEVQSELLGLVEGGMNLSRAQLQQVTMNRGTDHETQVLSEEQIDKAQELIKSRKPKKGKKPKGKPKSDEKGPGSGPKSPSGDDKGSGGGDDTASGNGDVPPGDDDNKPPKGGRGSKNK